MKFLAAHWKNLLLANYRVQAETLHPFLPEQTQLDHFEGATYLSLVAFLFDNTSVLGIPVPFHRRFEEVNLRFYVAPEKAPSIRAVTFIKEIVPKRIITWVANNLFHENYASARMAHEFHENTYAYSWGPDLDNRFFAKVESVPDFPPPGSLGEFITEHYWGYARAGRKTLEYQVEHPPWKCCDVRDFQIEIDFAKTYGPEFEFLNSRNPDSVLFAAGSAVTVSFPARI